MPEETEQPAGEKVSNSIRPDPLFKDVTRRAALAAGLKLINVELPQVTLADLILAVPEGTNLAGTMFDFLADYSIVDFKSENDDFDEFKLATNLSRTLAFFAKSQEVKYSQLLTVFVCSERPDRVIKHLNGEEVPITTDPATPWLLRARFGPLRVALVICRLLPFERRYYDWLMFAPAGSTKWREFVKMLLRNGEKTLLEQLKKLHLKEFRLMTIDIEEDLQGLTPEERAEREKDWLDLIEAEIDMLDRLNPELTVQLASKLVAGLTPEALVAGLTPEKIAALTPEQRQKILALLSQSTTEPAEEKSKPE